MRTTALDRFTGRGGRRRLVDAFADLPIANGDRALAERLARASVVESRREGEAIVQQGGEDTDFYLVLVGSVEIERNGRPGRVRHAGDHFGEMSTIDVHARRSATVRAREDSIFARVPERKFAAIAEDHPELWRRLAVEIARRLRQRLDDLPPRNDRPHVFIGSSREGLAIAEAIRDGIDADDVVVQIWTEGVFEASDTNIESLEQAVRAADFGALILTPDDKASSRGETKASPRDNVVFELGLFIGALGRRRAFVIRPTGDIKVPTDLLGMTPLHYDDADGVAEACTDLTAAIRRLGPK